MLSCTSDGRQSATALSSAAFPRGCYVFVQMGFVQPAFFSLKTPQEALGAVKAKIWPSASVPAKYPSK